MDTTLHTETQEVQEVQEAKVKESKKRIIKKVKVIPTFSIKRGKFLVHFK